MGLRAPAHTKAGKVDTPPPLTRGEGVPRPSRAPFPDLAESGRWIQCPYSPDERMETRAGAGWLEGARKQKKVVNNITKVYWLKTIEKIRLWVLNTY